MPRKTGDRPRITKALRDAARCELGMTSPTDLDAVIFALLDQLDPFKEFSKRCRGRLGPAHKLDF